MAPTPWEGFKLLLLTLFLEVIWADLLALAVDTPTACSWERVRVCRRYRRLLEVSAAVVSAAVAAAVFFSGAVLLS